MRTFDFQEYLTKGCIIPIIIIIIAILFIVLGIWWFIKIYRQFMKNRIRKFKAWLLLCLCIFMWIFGLISVQSIGQTLKYGIHLIGEAEEDAIETIGRVDTIELLSISPYYVCNGERARKTAEVEIDGIQYYFMSAEGLHSYDTIRFQYLPKSKMVLSYQEVSYSEWTPSVVDDTEEQSIDILFALIFTMAMIGFGIFSKSQYLDRKLEQKVYADDRKWDKNEVRFHSSYPSHAIAFSAILLIVGFAFAILFQNLVIPIFLFIVMIGGLAISFSQYKNWKLVYNDKNLILYSGIGQKETIPRDNIISINKTLENMFFSRGRVYSVVIIKYRSNFSKKSIIQTIKLDFRYHVGIYRFLDMFNDL